MATNNTTTPLVCPTCQREHEVYMHSQAVGLLTSCDEESFYLYGEDSAIGALCYCATRSCHTLIAMIKYRTAPELDLLFVLRDPQPQLFK